MSRDRVAPDLRRTSRRLGLQTGLLVAAVLTLVSLLTFTLYERAERRASDDRLSEAVTRIDSPDEAPAGVGVVIVTPEGRVQSQDLPDGLPDEEALAAVAADGQTRESEVRNEEQVLTVRTVRRGDRVTQAILDRSDLEQDHGRVLAALVSAGLFGLVLAGLLSAWLARRSVAPMAESLAMQRRFVADASHELRTPLTLLSTRVQLLARRMAQQSDDPGMRARVEADLAGVLGDTRQLTEILEDLLVAADTRETRQHERVDVAALVGEVVASAASAAAEAGVHLTAGAAPESLSVDGAPVSLRRALTALVDNAVTHARSRVDVTVERDGGRARILVTDDGPGIPDEVLPRMFDRFTSASAPEPGTGPARRHYGIGLALVADVAAAHSGRIEVRSRPDGGSGAVLALELPLRGGRRGL